MTDLLLLLGNNPIITGIASLCSILGLLLTLAVAFKTEKISKILKYNEVTSQYNKERMAFQKTFEGHRKSIIEDGIKSDRILKDILKNVEEYDFKFKELFTIKDRITIWKLKSSLRKRASEADFNAICNNLATLSGRLSKKEEIRHA